MLQVSTVEGGAELGEPAEQQANRKRKAPTTFYCVWTAPPDPELLHQSLVVTLAELLEQQRAAGGQVKKVE